jgi:hypothetical protein
VAQFQGAAGVDGVKQILDGDDVGPMAREQEPSSTWMILSFSGKALAAGIVMAPHAIIRWRLPSLCTHP